MDGSESGRVQCGWTLRLKWGSERIAHGWAWGRGPGCRFLETRLGRRFQKLHRVTMLWFTSSVVSVAEMVFGVLKFWEEIRTSCTS